MHSYQFKCSISIIKYIYKTVNIFIDMIQSKFTLNIYMDRRINTIFNLLSFDDQLSVESSTCSLE